jgi:hypothetical protein
MDTFLELLKLGGVGIIAGLFASLISNRDYRHRKYWELRVGAYQAAIEALSDLYYYFDKHYNAEIEYRELSQDFKSKISASWDQAHPKVRRLADSGAFLFSDRANRALREFMKDENENFYMDMLENGRNKSKKCLDELVACSKEDLRLKDGWFGRWL